MPVNANKYNVTRDFMCEIVMLWYGPILEGICNICVIFARYWKLVHCGAVITRSIFSQLCTKTSHSSPVRLAIYKMVMIEVEGGMFLFNEPESGRLLAYRRLPMRNPPRLI